MNAALTDWSYNTSQIFKRPKEYYKLRDDIIKSVPHNILGNESLDQFITINENITIASKYAEITIDNEIMQGIPTITGTRINVSLIVDCLANGMKIEEICEDYSLSKEQVRVALAYTSDVVDQNCI